MSLLMDALKRAEKARQAQADSTDASGDESESGQERELSLDPLDPTQSRESVAKSTAAEPASGAGFDPDAEKKDIPAMAEAGSEADDSSISQSMDFGDLSLDDTSATLPSMKSAQRSVDDYFDGTHSMSMSMDQVRTAIEEESAADAPAADHLAGTRTDSTTKETARAVFDAKAIAPPRAGRVFSRVVLPLLVLALITGAGFVYWDQMLNQLLKIVDGEPSLVVKRPPPPAPTPIAAAPATAVAEQTQTAPPDKQVSQPAPVAAATAADTADPSAGSQPLSGTLVAVETVPAATAPTTTSPTPQAPPADDTDAPVAAEDTEVSGDNLQAMADQALQEALPAAPVDLSAELHKLEPAATPEGGPVSFRITRNRRPAHVNKDLLQAYEAFQQGANEQAMAAYRRVLKRRPRDRDALLGVAALEMRAGNLAQATAIYYRLLNADPRDAMVKSALISLREDVDPITGESTIKNLLLEQPDSANLYFNLGNLFATQSRWSEAQQAYFNAYRLDAGNADYAYNLAISLDHLGKPRTALQFYQLAVELAQAQPASFAQSNALRRIGMLSAVQ